MKKICIITGASSGMGVCFAEQLAKESAEFKEKAYILRHNNSSDKAKSKADLLEENSSDELWIIARRQDKLEATAKSIAEDAKNFESKSPVTGENGWNKDVKLYPEVKVMPLDISGSEGALKLKKVFEEESSSEQIIINVLVNNAGFGTYGEFANTDTNREMEMVDLDCTSLTGITGFALPYMKKGSRIINTASLASFAPLGNFAVYGACKAYVLSFTIALAAELKTKGIKVTALCPGSVSTEFANVASKGARKEVLHGYNADKTVEHCVKASRKGKLYSMKTFKWKFKANASKLVKRSTIAWFTYKYCKRPSN